MKDDAIIPLRLFRSRVFSMATILGVLVGFGMFGAMLTLPLYLQIVFGLSPTASGFATLPMMAGLMIASIASGQIIARTGKYRIFPITGTLGTGPAPIHRRSPAGAVRADRAGMGQARDPPDPKQQAATAAGRRVRAGGAPARQRAAAGRTDP